MTELRRLEGEREEVVEPAGIHATPFRWIAPALIPTRKWLLGKHIVRGYVSLTAAVGSAGKTALVLAEAASLATGNDFLALGAASPRRVWFVGIEDPLDEYQRRLAAIGLHYRLDVSLLEHNLFLDSGRAQNFVIAHDTKRGVDVNEALIASVIETIRDNKIDVFIVDPFVACHDVPENDNGKVSRVVRAFGDIAEKAACGVEIVHHIRKPSISQELTADDARGASALVNAARSVRLLSPMSSEDAKLAGVEDRRRFFKIVNGKANLYLPPEKAAWRQLVTAPLGNGQGGPDDEVGVVAPWAFPDAFEGVTNAKLLEIQKAIDGKSYRANAQATNWVGHPIAAILGLNPRNEADRRRISTLIATWTKTGVFVVTSKIEGRKDRPIIEAGAWIA